MSSLLAGARLVLRSGLHSLPRHHVRLSPARYLLCSPRLCSIAAEQEGNANNETPIAFQLQRSRQFDWALSKLDLSVRRTGRITKTLLLKIFHDSCRSGTPGSNQVLLLLRSCGSLLPELPLTERTELAHKIWEKLQASGTVYDVSHYNALLKVYLQNEHKFSPTEFLAKMEDANVEPNRVTYQRLIAAYCNEGDIEGASKILGFMKSKDLPISEAVFNNLITGHARAGDLESAKNILNVMQGAGIEPGADTRVALLTAYAEKGDIDSIKQTLGNVETTKGVLSARELMQVISSLAKAGYPQHVQDVLEHMQCDKIYRPDAMNLCLSLMTQGFEDTAFQVLKAFFSSSKDQHENAVQHGNFFLQHCVALDLPASKVKQFIDGMRELNLHSTPLQFTTHCALSTHKADLALDLMKIMKEDGLPVRPHYCWPLLVHYQKEKNVKGTINVLKALNDIGVEPDLQTYSYVLPVFGNEQQALDALVNNECYINNNFLHVMQLRKEASAGNLENVLALLSSPDSPSVDLDHFRSSLIIAFRKFSDIHLMAQITALLYKDDHDCQAPSGSTDPLGYFLYYLIDSMSESEVRAKEARLRQYFHQLKKMDVTISINLFRGIRNLLFERHIPELSKSVASLANVQVSQSISDPDKINALEEKIKLLKAENNPILSDLGLLISKVYADENLEKALELRATYGQEHFTIGMYASLISLCCRQGKAEEAFSLKQELDLKYPSAVLDVNKYLQLVTVFADSGRLSDAIDILKELKEKGNIMEIQVGTFCFRILNTLAMRGEVEAVNQLHEAIVTLDLVKPSSNFCSPLVLVHLEKGDLPQALDAMIDCSKKYSCSPLMHNYLCRLMEARDTELLQKAMDHVSREKGEMAMLYSLFFAFLETGKYKEAKKIIETPGLRAQPGRLDWFAKRCIAMNKMEMLENMVDSTQKLFECDRDELYFYLLQLCKAYYVFEEAEKTSVVLNHATYTSLIKVLLSNGLLKEALKVKTIAENHIKGFTLNSVACSLLIITQARRDYLKDAITTLETMLKDDKMPSQLSITRLVQALAMKGDVKTIEAVEQMLVKLEPVMPILSRLYTSNKILAHLTNGNVDETMEFIESLYTGENTMQVTNMSFVLKVIMEKRMETVLDKFRAMAERLANHFSVYRPVTELFLQYIHAKRKEDARQLLERFSCIEEQTSTLLSFIIRTAHKPGQVVASEVISDLLELVPHFPNKEVPYSYLMKCYESDKDVDGAFALYEKMKTENIPTNELILKRLAGLLKNAGRPVPFTEPPESFQFYVQKLKEKEQDRDDGDNEH
uniref:Leucine rich pentatricopeptide repeat containing n=1 Tax=Leptobrachium leishanense TaxID=445787 RepID=A0A8C5MAX7_9ANUR